MGCSDEMGLGCGCLLRLGQGRYQESGERRAESEEQVWGAWRRLGLGNCCVVTKQLLSRCQTSLYLSSITKKQIRT